MSRILDNRFRQTLGEILRRAPRLRGGRQHAVHTRRRRRCESGTFSGHRAYSEGEDLRNLDWNVYARTEELFLKVLEDEDKVGLTILLDHSRSMQADDRWVGAVRLAAILGGLALVHLDGLHVVWGAAQDSTLQGVTALGRYLELLEGLRPRDDKPESLVAHLLEHGVVGRLSWISDFARPQDFATPLAALRKQGCRCTGWLPVLATDRAPVAAGYLLFEDPETGARELLQVDAALRRAMADELQLLARQQDAVFATVGFPLLRYRVPEVSDHSIAAWSGDGVVYST